MELSGPAIREKIQKAGLYPPEILTLMITGSCNLSCPHCLLDCGKTNPGHVPEKNILRIIDDFSSLDGKKIILTGGEPLLHPGWFNILEHACKAGFAEVVLQTNGVMVTGGIVKKIKGIGPVTPVIQISIDGAVPETNDKIRGRGSYHGAVKAARLFASAGFGDKVKIAFTEMSHNFDDIPEMLKLADNLGAGQFVSGTIVKSGRAKNTDWISLPDRKQVRNLIELYETDHEFRTLYDRLGSISAIEWYRGRDVPSDHVCNCISMPFINAGGKIYPCVMNISEDISMGNVHEQGIKQVILKGLCKWPELIALAEKRSESLGECRACEGRDHCKGGCMGRAQAAAGDMMTVEDRCGLRREIYCYGR